MTGYRLTFNAMEMRANDLADAMIAARDTLGEVVPALQWREGVEVLGYRPFSFANGVNQFVIRFAAPDDATAHAAVVDALRVVKAPIDGVRLDRRERRYTPVGA